jgi:EmrB/QacA subfamily drug resistance transporter
MKNAECSSFFILHSKFEIQAHMRKWLPLLVLSLALAIIIIDTTLLNVSLATLVRELHTTLQSLQWVISAYSLTLAALTVTGGRVGDLFGRKKMFRLGAIVFAAGSFIASISRSLPVLLIGESIVEGIGAALMMPATASLLVSKYRGHDRSIAFGFWGAIAAAASAVGPILGGFLTTHYSWRWGFRINVVVAAILVAGSVIIDESEPLRARKIDVIGVLLSALGLFLIVFAIIESPTNGWSHGLVPIAMAAGVLVLIAFAFWEARVERGGGTPIVSMKLFSNTSFIAGASVTGTLMLAQNGVIFSLPVFLLSVLNLDAFHTGLSLLPMSVMLLIVSPATGFLSKRVPHKRLVQAGLVVSVVALLVLRASLAADMNPAMLIPGLALYGAGMGLVLSQINNLTLSSVSVRDAGEASGVTNTFRQVGSSFGAAIIGAILLNAILISLEGAVASSPTIPPQSKTAIDGTLKAHASGLAFGELESFAALPPAVRGELTRDRREATTRGIRKAMLYGTVFMLLGLIVSNWLPLRARQESE